MATPHPSVSAAWPELARQWQELLQQWSRWWLPGAPRAGEARSERAPTTPWTAPPWPLPAPPPFDPSTLAALNERFAPRFQALWAAAQQGLVGGTQPMPEVATPAPNDRRFTSPAWRDQPYFAYLKQAYLLYAEYLTALAAAAALPPIERRRLQFVTRQYLDAIAPTNFPATNPDVLARAVETEGESLLHGFRNLLEDAGKGRITMSDESAFEVGRNLATTPGSVVYRNDLVEIIQYDPVTPTVHRRPLVMVPPCINKYYILDLTEQNSFVRHAVAQGHTTFMISWRNVPPELGGLTWDDYLEQGPLTAIRVAREITGSKTVNTLGFCVGGTILACALAVLAARGDTTVASATFLTTMLDFADPGDVGVYISPQALAAREPALCAGARLPGSELATAFASLRANELVWNYVVNNYLKGRTPPAFDLLYWNADSANLAGPMYAYYMREMYIGNRLREPGALTMLGQPIDLGRITVPTYVYASRDDHIVPWRSAYRTLNLLGGTEKQFVLGASGHIAGVVNPAAKNRRSHWIGKPYPADPEEWFSKAQEHQGSWWPLWSEWLGKHGGGSRKAPAKAGSAKYKPIEPAPGRYVKQRIH